MLCIVQPKLSLKVWKSPEREYPWRGKCWGWALKVHVPLSTLEWQCYISCSLSLNHSRSSSVAVRILELPSGLNIEILSNSVSLSVTSLELLLEKKLGDSCMFMLRPASLNHQEITMTSTLNMRKSCMNWHMRVINHTPETLHTLPSPVLSSSSREETMVPTNIPKKYSEVPDWKHPTVRAPSKLW